MQHFLGIDLGSTTSKAVLVDEQGNVVGQGLTNTRSNYDVAAKVARSEAVWDAELARLEHLLEAAKVPDAVALALRIREACRLQGAIERLTALRARCLELVKTAPDASDAYTARLDKLFAHMEDDG